MSKITEKKNWIVRVKCEVLKELCCDGCTEEQARAMPFAYCVHERELDQMDYEVKDVEENN